MTSNAVVFTAYNDLAAACAVQQRSMQRQSPESDRLSYSARCRQLAELGGDCYGFIPLPGNRLGLFVADASGKGLPAALAVAGVQSSLRTAVAFAGCDPAAVVDMVNRQTHACCDAGRYATLFFGIVDEATSTLRYISAGHNPALLLHRDGSASWLAATGLPVGMFAESGYAERAVQLSPGDRIVIYTDGVTEATDLQGRELGVEGLERAAIESSALEADEAVRAIFNAVDEFSHGQQADDSTVLVLQVG
jgi:phosphoserine phosphatase RsbU/P